MTNLNKTSNDNIVAFPQAMTGGSQFDPAAVIRRPRSYAQMPAHIIRDAILNKRVMELQDDGFEVMRFEGRTIFVHDRIPFPMSFSEACATQDRFARESAQ